MTTSGLFHADTTSRGQIWSYFKNSIFASHGRKLTSPEEIKPASDIEHDWHFISLSVEVGFTKSVESPILSINRSL
jgi:hypothetical protein